MAYSTTDPSAMSRYSDCDFEMEQALRAVKVSPPAVPQAIRSSSYETERFRVVRVLAPESKGLTVTHLG